MIRLGLLAATCVGLGTALGAQLGAQTLPEGLEGLGGGGDGPILQPTQPAAPLADGPILQPTGAAPSDTGTRGAALRFSGFVEARSGTRQFDDPLQGATPVSELRFHLEAETGREVIWTLALDVIADEVSDQDIDLGTGEGPLDLREAHVFFRLGDQIDVRLGRQILTWGTGDLVFVNDLFPKDYVSFVAGRDDDYLKAPVDAIRVSAFSEWVNLDFVAMASGQTDRLITGDRLSFTDPATGLPTVTAPVLHRPDEVEYAARLYRTLGSVEAAFYGYRGHWKSPAGQDAQGRATFPKLDVIGASVRGPMLDGIGSAELGYYGSRDDPHGTDPAIRNSEFRWLLGYEREIARNTTLGLQYSQTTMQDYGAYLANLPVAQTPAQRGRDIATMRLTRLFVNQTLTASAFWSHSPDWDDGNVRLNIDYHVTDNLGIGAYYNRFYGDLQTPLGQFKNASSFGIVARLSF